MTPADWPRPDALAERLLVIDPDSGDLRDARIRDLPALLEAGDLLVVNDAATLPASLPARTVAGRWLEVRLVGESAEGTWRAVLFGDGDWRIPTENRTAPPVMKAGESLVFEGSSGRTLGADIEEVSALFPRVVELRFREQGAALWASLYRIGRPVQYSYVKEDLALEQVQTRYASRPWAVELPSAGRPLTWGTFRELAGRGVRIAAVTHGAGLSSTGDAGLDAALPLPERYDVPAETQRAIEETRLREGRVVAVGTSVVRALEGSARDHGGRLVSGASCTNLVLGPDDVPRVVDGLLTGIHEPGTSHFHLLEAFVPRELLLRASAYAERAGYLGHEFGDSCLILGERIRSRSALEGFAGRAERQHAAAARAGSIST